MIQLDKKHVAICQKIMYMSAEGYFNEIIKISNQTKLDITHYICFDFTAESTVQPSASNSKQLNYAVRIIYLKNRKYKIFQIPISELANYLIMNSDIRYIFLPINYYNSFINKAHVGSLVFDNHKKELFILESNGTHPVKIVNSLFNIITNELKRYGLYYKYIPLDTWLLTKRSINRVYELDSINFGICALCTLYLVNQLIQLSTKESLNVYLQKLNSKDIIQEIANFINNKKFDI